ncbi:hypothetical protein EJ997_03745 [Flaviflexus ciconiae]|uniref:DUF6199 domain-containing protein n=1 Tax=Flaviflexus ciconiae TaxID=2496867 RepID=A0A3Q9G3L2_9ACTO|nr:DUF6199 family natural product biosynthesis protein [Flaviflexus ciconiae]AZQ76593.1 hypothetical protein EJ997_03745 [Flaviflexus ciconiae]
MEFLFLLLAAFGAWSLLAPGSQFEIMNTLRYRDPEYHEPSSFALIMTRISGLLIIGFSVWMNFHMPEPPP